MGYNPTTQIISQPVSIYDVQQCLGSGSPDLATLCMRDNINMWSPHKPIYSPKVVQLTNEDWQGGAHTDPAYKTGGGIKKAIVTGTAFLNSSGSGGVLPSAIWTHDKPILDGICAFRLTDFAGYWHTIGRMFYIGTIFGNISNIIIPSSSSEEGANLGFSMWFDVSTGKITAHELFGDCWDNYYPGVIMCCGGGYKFNYVKTTNSPISAYINSTASISFNTRDFMDQMSNDWTEKGISGSPYGSYPFRKGDNWTACLVLISRQFTGGDGSNHKLNGSESIVRLEYEAPTNGVYVDRRTLPVKPSKYNTIDWLKVNVTIQKYISDRTGYDCYKIRSVVVTAKMLTADSVSFRVDASINAHIGIVVVPGQSGSGGSSVNVTGYINPIVFSGTVGEVQKEYTPNNTQGYGIPETSFYISQSAGIGNKNCNIYLTFVHATKGTFEGQFSFDVSNGDPVYSKENELL